jgi:hypothetical protein
MLALACGGGKSWSDGANDATTVQLGANVAMRVRRQRRGHPPHARGNDLYGRETARQTVTFPI